MCGRRENETNSLCLPFLNNFILLFDWHNIVDTDFSLFEGGSRPSFTVPVQFRLWPVFGVSLISKSYQASGKILIIIIMHRIVFFLFVFELYCIYLVLGSWYFFSNDSEASKNVAHFKLFTFIKVEFNPPQVQWTSGIWTSLTWLGWFVHYFLLSA